MLKMYGVTALFAVAAWVALSAIFARGPIEDHGMATVFYGGMVPLTTFAFWWNVVRFKNISLPPLFEQIRIPFGAIALGINSAYYNISFIDSKAQELLSMPAVKNLWLGFEVALTISLIIGIYRWEAERNHSQEAHLQTKT